MDSALQTPNTIVTADGKTLCLYDWSLKEPSITVALIHGYGEYAGRYKHVASYLNSKAIGMVAADLRGHGHSVGRRGYVGQFEDYFHDVDAIIAYARERSVGQPVVLMGHSMGGLICFDWLLAREAPGLRALAITSPFLGLARRIAPLVLKMIRFIAKFTRFLFVPSVLKGKDVCRDPKLAKEYDNDPLVNRRGNIHWFGEALKAMDRVHSNVQRFDIPLILFYAGKDLVASPDVTDEFASSLTMSGKLIERFPGLYHEILNEPVEIRDVLLERIAAWILGHADKDE